MRILNHPLRSVLYVPADNERAMAKVFSLQADAIVFDLEDAVAPQAKEAARERLRSHFRETEKTDHLRAIRINRLDAPDGPEDFLAARACQPDAIVLPKVNDGAELQALMDALAETDAPETIDVWAMIETARGVANAAAITQRFTSAESRLSCLFVGVNDLYKETGVDPAQGRDIAHPWLMQIVLAARCGGQAVLDAVYNDHRDLDGFKAYCARGSAMGFDGATCIHPAQIGIANQAYAPSAEAIAEAQAIVDAFALPENEGRGVISLGGRMVERLHLEQALALLDKARTMD